MARTKCGCCRRPGPPPITVGRPVCADSAALEGKTLEAEEVEPADAPGDEGDVAPAFDSAHQPQGILGIPIEMLAQICAYLQPLDLRSLSLTNQAFRRILMSRDSRQLWKSARVGTYDGMPECPEDLSEPQYTRLVFVSECFTCEALAINIDLLNRVKSCSDCLKKNYLTKAQLTRRCRGFPPHLRFPPDEISRSERPYYKPKVDTDYDSFLNLKSTDEREVYEAAVASRTAHALESRKALEMWMRIENSKQAQARSALHQSRRESIKKKMIELGYEAKDISYVPADTLQLLYKLHDVSDEEWKAMRPALEELAVQNRDFRLAATANYVPSPVQSHRADPLDEGEEY